VNSIVLRQDSGTSTELVSKMVVSTTFNEAATFPTVPAPGAAALLGLAALVSRRRR